MQKRIWQICAVCMAMLQLACVEVVAQHNYQTHLLGDRASGMGAAVIAGADSVDACYYNPAGLSQVGGNTLSLSASLYGRQTYRAKDGLFPGEDVEFDSFVTIPSSVGSIWKVDDRLALAFAAFIPHRISYNELHSFQNNQHIYNYNMDDQVLWVGPSGAWICNDELAMGAAVYGVYRSYNEYISLLYNEVDTGYARGLKSDDWGVMAIMGMQYQALEKLRLGLVLQTPSLHITGDGEYQVYLVSPSETMGVYSDDVQSEMRMPMKIGVGAAWLERRRYALELNVSYYFADSFDMHYFYDGDQRHSSRIRRGEVLNLNMGVEYYYREYYPLRAGFFTDFSAVSSLDPGDPDNAPRIDCYGISASVGKHVGHMSLNLGVIYVFGRGHSLGWVFNEEEGLIKVSNSARKDNIYLVVNTAYVF